MESFESDITHNEETRDIEVGMTVPLHQALFTVAWQSLATALDRGERMPHEESEAYLQYMAVTSLHMPPMKYVTTPKNWKFLTGSLLEHMAALPEDQAKAADSLARRMEVELAFSDFQASMRQHVEVFVVPTIPDHLPEDFQ